MKMKTVVGWVAAILVSLIVFQILFWAMGIAFKLLLNVMFILFILVLAVPIYLVIRKKFLN